MNFTTMSIIDRIINDIEKQVACYSDWHVKITTQTGENKVYAKESHSWDVETPEGAKAIKEYLVAMGMNDGTLAEPHGSFVYIEKITHKS